MYLAIVMTALMVVVMAVGQESCGEYCRSLETDQKRTPGRPDCECSLKSNNFKKQSLNHYHKTKQIPKVEDSNIYYEPSEGYSNSISFARNPFHIVNPVLKNQNHHNKKEGIMAKHPKHESLRQLEGKLKENKNIVRKINIQTEEIPLYLDIDIHKSYNNERSEGISETYDLEVTEHNLIECIDLHILVFLRNNDVDNHLREIWDDNKNKKYEHLSDTDLMIQIQNKCHHSTEVINNSLQEITSSKPRKMEFGSSQEKIERTIKNKKLDELENVKDIINTNLFELPITEPGINNAKEEDLIKNNKSFYKPSNINVISRIKTVDQVFNDSSASSTTSVDSSNISTQFVSVKSTYTTSFLELTNNYDGELIKVTTQDTPNIRFNKGSDDFLTTQNPLPIIQSSANVPTYKDAILSLVTNNNETPTTSILVTSAREKIENNDLFNSTPNKTNITNYTIGKIQNDLNDSNIIYVSKTGHNSLSDTNSNLILSTPYTDYYHNPMTANIQKNEHAIDMDSEFNNVFNKEKHLATQYSNNAIPSTTEIPLNEAKINLTETDSYFTLTTPLYWTNSDVASTRSENTNKQYTDNFINNTIFNVFDIVNNSLVENLKGFNNTGKLNNVKNTNSNLSHINPNIVLSTASYLNKSPYTTPTSLNINKQTDSIDTSSFYVPYIERHNLTYRPNVLNNIKDTPLFSSNGKQKDSYNMYNSNNVIASTPSHWTKEISKTENTNIQTDSTYVYPDSNNISDFSTIVYRDGEFPAEENITTPYPNSSKIHTDENETNQTVIESQLRSRTSEFSQDMYKTEETSPLKEEARNANYFVNPVVNAKTKAKHFSTESVLDLKPTAPGVKTITTLLMENKDRVEYPEEEIKIPKVISKELKNDNVVSLVNGTEAIPNNDFREDSVYSESSNNAMELNGKTTPIDNFSIKKFVLNTVNTVENKYEKNVATRSQDEVVGKIYFIFGEKQLPARFVQDSEGQISLGIDGTKLCDKLGNGSVIMVAICKCYNSENCIKSDKMDPS